MPNAASPVFDVRTQTACERNADHFNPFGALARISHHRLKWAALGLAATLALRATGRGGAFTTGDGPDSANVRVRGDKTA